MKSLLNYRFLVPFLGILLLFFFLRLYSLNGLPIFTDEAIYIRWAQIGGNDSNWRFISLVDGKQPLFVWFIMLFIRLIEDPLIAGRLVSVFSGFFTLLGLSLVSWELFRSKKVVLLSAFFYVIFPFAQVYDRMALMDSMVGTFAVWSIYFSILMVRKVRLDLAYTLGIVIGAGAITKSSGFISAYMLPFTLLLFNYKDKFFKNKLLKWVLLAGFSFFIAQAIYNTLRLSPFFYIIAQKNASFIYPISEWVKNPFISFYPNLLRLWDWSISYLTPSFMILIALAFVLSRKFLREKILLLLYFALPFLALAFLGRSIFPRYIYFMTLSLLPLAALGFEELFQLMEKRIKTKQNVLLVSLVTLVVFAIYPLYSSITFVVNPFKASIAEADMNQYVLRWPAGWGIKESAAFFNEKSKNQNIFVATEGTFGLMPYSYEIFLNKNKNIEIKGYWPIENEIPLDVKQKAQKIPTYFVFYQPCSVCTEDFQPPKSWKVEEIFRANHGPLTVYRVLP